MKFQNDITLPSLTPQATILGLTNEASNIYNPLNNILLVFKYHVYRLRETNTQYTYFNRQPNRKKEKRKINKPC